MAMTVVQRFYDGGEWLSQTSATVNGQRWWNGGAGTIQTASGRNSTSAYSIPSSGSLLFTPSTTLGSVNAVIFGAAIASGSSNISRTWMTISSAGTTFLKVKFDSTGKVLITSGTDALYATGQTTCTGFGTTNFRYIEVGLYVQGASTQIAVYISGVVDPNINYISLPSVAPTSWSAMSLENSSTSALIVDDIYIHSGTSSPVVSDFLGDVAVFTVSPDADGLTGAASGWLADDNSSTGFANELNTADTTAPPTTNYIFASAPGSTYTMSHLPVNALATDIVAVQVSCLAGKDGTGAAVAGKVKCSLSNAALSPTYDSAENIQYSIVNTYSYIHGSYTVQPFTNNQWKIDNSGASGSADNINNAYFGASRV